jgi:exopolysaccharide biosynthesis WecB/TagA/CpsF family protein
VHRVTYESAFRYCCLLARSGRPASVSACNTHIVTLARMEYSFHEVMQAFDLVVPDGYPLIWRMNSMGASLQDRVYGPYLMRYILQRTPAPWGHFFFGGTESCLERLCAAARALNPDIDIRGTLSPPFRVWTEEAEAGFAATIRESGANFVWVALGGERQERWIQKNLHRHEQGVFFAVGDAFELLAGSRAFAPKWMQSRGLTWLYRLMQEPSRLWKRYFSFNSRFLYYNARDALLGPPKWLSATPPPCRKPRIAFLGSRGVPARYSGFEVVVEELGRCLAERGYPVTVYNRFPRYASKEKFFRGMRVIVLPTIPTKSLDTIVHTALSALHAIVRRYDIIYLCGVGNAVIGSLLRAAGMRVVINVDGADFRRSKWGSFARVWLLMGERLAEASSDVVIADNRQIVDRYRREYGVEPLFLSYGVVPRPHVEPTEELSRWGLERGGFILFVSRLTPENDAGLLLRAFSTYRGPLKLVICGSADYESAHMRALRKLADERVIFTGARYGDAYVALSRSARLFVLPSTIEATRLVLLDQMIMGSAILYHDCPATREVIGDAGEPFGGENPAADLAGKLEILGADVERCARLGHLAQERAEKNFSWEAVTDRYEEIFGEIFQTGSATGSARVVER